MPFQPDGSYVPGDDEIIHSLIAVPARAHERLNRDAYVLVYSVLVGHPMQFAYPSQEYARKVFERAKELCSILDEIETDE
jgi:hypothetical protein